MIVRRSAPSSAKWRRSRPVENGKKLDRNFTLFAKVLDGWLVY
jgi:hypothetical protein